MKRKVVVVSLILVLLGIDLVGPAVVLAETTATNSTGETLETISSNLSLPTASSQSVESTESKSSAEAGTDSATSETQATKDSQEKQPAENTQKEKAAVPVAGETITDALLAKGTLLTMDGVEFSQTDRTRLLNNTPVQLNLDFSIADKDYAPGSTYEMQLPDHLGYSSSEGTIKNLDASWKVTAENQLLTIQFNQRITDASFSLNLKSYLYTDSQPLMDVTIDAVQKSSYPIDLYEEVDPIKYSETQDVIGLNGTIYYNLDRNLTGKEKLSLALTATPGAVFEKEDRTAMSVYEYDVDVKGNVLPASEKLLTEGSDYVISSNTLYDTSVEINQLNQQKAYGIRYNFLIGLASVSDYSYLFSKGYPTTGFGNISLKQTTAKYGGLALTAKTSKDQKEVYSRGYDSIASGSMYEKGNYSLYIHQMPTKMTTGQQIILTSQNGQPIELVNLVANNAAYESVVVSDYFDVETADGTVTLTAKKDSTLRLGLFRIKVPFNEKDIIVNAKSPLINQAYKIIEDTYVKPMYVLNPTSVETAWGNYYQNGAYAGDASVGLEGSTSAPLENVEIAVEHPAYLSLRQLRNVSFYYKLGEDYTITPTDKGSVVKFTTPVTQSIQFDLGFNYVPDSLATNVFIPVDKLPVTIKSDGYDTVNTTVTTGRKLYSERTLQASKNQFLVNARQDTQDDLVVKTKIPQNTEVVYDIYDVSNDQVDSIYPQYWDRGYYFDQPMSEQSEAYPVVTFDEASSTYTFDFGKTNKRYIIEYKYANGWLNTPAITVQGSAKEPLYKNQEMVANARVENEGSEIIGATQSAVPELNNLTQSTVKTQNIDAKTKKVVNPTFELSVKGNTKGSIDVNSIQVTDVPETAYQVEKTETGVKLVFSDYTLTENIEISYNVISKNPGQVSTQAVISSDSIDSLDEATRTATTPVMNLQFSEGDSEGIVYQTQADFHVLATDDEKTTIPDVDLVLVDEVTGQSISFKSDDQGDYHFAEIMSGKYLLFVTNAPEGYTIPDEYLQGKEIQLMKANNDFKVYLDAVPDYTSVAVQDSTLYVGGVWNAADNFVSATDASGAEIGLEQLVVTGEVDTTQAGDYQVAYQNGSKTATATVHVLANQEAVQAKDSAIYVGDGWNAEENFVSATDKAGNAVDFEAVATSGDVDTNTPGSYEVTYSYGGASAVAVVTVLADQTSVMAKDSTIRVGDKWEAADNFVSATDKAGGALSLDQLKVEGDVNTAKAGDYEVVYRNEGKSAVAVIHVVADQTTIAAKDSSLYVGDEWTAADNFISATDKSGKTVDFKDVTVSGIVDTEKAGKYQITYSYQGATAVATVTVKENQASLSVVDSTIYVGDNWTPADNFVSAVDKDGKAIEFKEVRTKGTVDTSKVDEYEVEYTIAENGTFTDNLLQRVLAPEATVTATAKIRVVKKDEGKKEDEVKKETGSSDGNTPVTAPKQTPTTRAPEQIVRTTTAATSKSFPKTGEQQQSWMYILGGLLVIAAVYFLRKRKHD